MFNLIVVDHQSICINLTNSSLPNGVISVIRHARGTRAMSDYWKFRTTGRDINIYLLCTRAYVIQLCIIITLFHRYKSLILLNIIQTNPIKNLYK